MRLFRRRRDALDLWRAELPETARWSAEPQFRHAPDLDPSEVDIPERDATSAVEVHVAGQVWLREEAACPAAETQLPAGEVRITVDAAE